jgi:hypothetical protein
MKQVTCIGHLKFTSVMEELSDGAEEGRGLQPARVTAVLMG